MDGSTRRLAAILVADVVGYSAMMADDEAGTLAGKSDDAERFARRMIELNPRGYLVFHVLGAVLAGIGTLDEAVDASTNAWRLGRHEPLRFDTASDIGYAHYLLGSYEAALAWGKQSIDLVPDYLQPNVLLAGVYAQLERTAEAEQHIGVILASGPGFSCAKHRTRLVYRRTQDRDLVIDGLLKAGLPA